MLHQRSVVKAAVSVSVLRYLVNLPPSTFDQYSTPPSRELADPVSKRASTEIFPIGAQKLQPDGDQFFGGLTDCK
jgi:hypothetical protein